jgi:uncharacterized protein YyaL (SSP411 family)
VKQLAAVYEAGGGLETELLRFIQSTYRPNPIIAASAYPPSIESPALLMDRPLQNGQPTIYVCEGFVCQNPVTSIPELEKLL